LIKRYTDKYNIDWYKYVIRFLFGGEIIKENDYFYQYKVKNSFSIQIYVSKKIIILFLIVFLCYISF
jgi:hypothetical protein